MYGKYSIRMYEGSAAFTSFFLFTEYGADVSPVSESVQFSNFLFVKLPLVFGLGLLQLVVNDSQNRGLVTFKQDHGFKAEIQVNLGQWVNNAKMHCSNFQPMGFSGVLNTGP